MPPLNPKIHGPVTSVDHRLWLPLDEDVYVSAGKLKYPLDLIEPCPFASPKLILPVKFPFAAKTFV
jgi:hypothetical protein